MAFPTIPTGARILWSTSLDTSGGTITSPNLSSLTKNAGDLLVAIVGTYDGNSTNAEFSSWGGSFTEFVDSATTSTPGIGAAYKWSTGSETGTFTVAVAGGAAGSDAAFVLMSIPGAHATTPPEGGSRADNTSAAADPVSFDPAGWGTEDTLWIVFGLSGETATTGSYTGIASAPTNFTDYSESGITADVVGGVEGAVAFRQLNAASVDVGGFTLDTSNARNAAIVIAVRPAPAATDLAPAPVAAVLTVPAPTFTSGSTFEPAPVAVVLTVPAPTMIVDTVLAPAPVVAVLAVTSPTLALSLDLSPTPIPAVLLVPEPTIDVPGGSITLTPEPIPVTLSVTAPTIELGAYAFTPDAIPVTLTIPGPSLELLLALSPNPVAVTLLVPVPTLDFSGGPIVLSPDPVAVTLTLPGVLFCRGFVHSGSNQEWLAACARFWFHFDSLVNDEDKHDLFIEFMFEHGMRPDLRRDGFWPVRVECE